MAIMSGCHIDNSSILDKQRSSGEILHPELSYACAGTGTLTDPYQICTSEQLASLSSNANSNVWNKYFKLMNNLDMTASNVNPIGNSDSAFSGYFDGNNKTISAVTINNTSLANSGFFGVLQNATVKNLILSNFNITNSTVLANNTGLLVGKAMDSNVIENVTISGAVSGSTVGGIIGFHTGTGTLEITTVTNTSVVSGSNSGGIIGSIDLCNLVKITNSNNYGTVNATSSSGGVLGIKSCDIWILKSFNSGSISGDQRVGGLIGSDFSGATSQPVHIDRSYNSGSVSCNGNNCQAGGLAGIAWLLRINNSYNTGNIQATGTDNLAGGIVAWSLSTLSISNSYNTGSITNSNVVASNEYCGGLIGYFSGMGSVLNSFSTGNVLCPGQAGLLYGFKNVFSSTTNTYYSSASSCIEPPAGTCSNYGSAQATHNLFYVSTNNPLSAWDFATIWQTTATFPIIQ